MMAVDTINHILFLDSLIKGDRSCCSEMIRQELQKNKSIIDLYDNVIKKSMYAIGELWEKNKISVATEHLASAIIESILNEIYADVVLCEKSNQSVVLTCVEKEMHHIGIKMVNDVFEMNRWKTYYLGASTPTSALIGFIKETNPQMLGISVGMYARMPMLLDQLRQLTGEFPDLPVLVGGQAFRYGEKDVVSQFENVSYIPDLLSLDYYLKKLG